MADARIRSDEELLTLARDAPEGDMRAFEALVQRYQTRITANCRYITRQPDDAEDLAQEVFVKVFFGMDRFESRSSFRTWIQRIKVNHCLNHVKKSSRVVVQDLGDAGLEELGVEPTAERRMNRIDDRERIGEILDSLSDTLRIPLILRDMDRLSYQEIAETLGVGLSAVKMRIKRAREEFRSRYSRPAARRERSPVP